MGAKCVPAGPVRQSRISAFPTQRGRIMAARKAKPAWRRDGGRPRRDSQRGLCSDLAGPEPALRSRGKQNPHSGGTERGVDGIRTRGEGFADPCLTTWRRRRIRKVKSGRWDSNPRPSPWQGDVLPLNHARSSWPHLLAESAETQDRTGDTAIFSRVLYQLSYLGQCLVC
jgi:hypothetical protein